MLDSRKTWRSTRPTRSRPKTCVKRCWALCDLVIYDFPLPVNEDWEVGGHSIGSCRKIRIALTSRLHSVENPLLCLDFVCSSKLVYGCDGDLVSKLAKCSCQHLSPFLFGSWISFAGSLDKSHPFMQDLPNYATEPMGNGPDGGLIA